MVDEPLGGSRCNGAAGPRGANRGATVTRSETRDQEVRTTAHASHYCESQTRVALKLLLSCERKKKTALVAIPS